MNKKPPGLLLNDLITSSAAPDFYLLDLTLDAIINL